MNNRSRLAKNIVYQTVYQILTVITPLITAPYVSRVLGANGLGLFTYTHTNAMYFTLFAMLGVANYGSRSIASVQDNKEARSEVFWNIYSVQVLMTLLMIALYSGYVLLFVKSNAQIVWIQGFIILACSFDVNWYFFGVEKFKVTVTRNIIIKILTVISVLLFVNQDTGVLGYTLVMSIGTLLSNIAVVPFLRREIFFVYPKARMMAKHLKPNMILFVPVLATSVFHIMDKTMLGSLGGLTQLGYYTNADKVINIPIGIINGLGTVYMPRITSLRLNNKEVDVKPVLYSSLELYSFVVIALSLGLAAISSEFAPWFYGPGFEPCADLIKLFAPVFIFKSFSVYVRMNILIPYHNEKTYTVAVLAGAFINLIANSVFIPICGAQGAVIGTLLAEGAVWLIQVIKIPIKLSLKRVINSVAPYLIFGLLMIIVIRIIARLTISATMRIIAEISGGGMLYLGLCLLFWKISGNKNSILSIFHKKQ